MMIHQIWQWLQMNYSWTALWSAWGAVILGYAGFLLLERLLPASHNPGFRELAADFRANLVFILLDPLALLLGAFVAGDLAKYFGGPLIHLDLTAVSGGSIVAFALAFLPFFVFDFFYYWFHRCQHAWTWLWHVHRLHHSERYLNVTTNYRHHWLEDFFRAFFILLPMNWLVAISPVHSVVAALLIRQWSSFFHANIKVNLGPLTGVICGPQYHRIHHSIEEHHVGRNFAAFFPLWDWIFGSYWRPGNGEWPETGLPDTNGVWGFRELLFSPFVAWWRRIAASFK